MRLKRGKEQRVLRGGVRRKITLAAGIGLGYFWGYALLCDIVRENHREMPELLAEAVNRLTLQAISLTGIFLYLYYL